MKNEAELFKKRNKAMAALYRDGQTLEQVGQRYHLTRERVRQILERDCPGVIRRLRRKGTIDPRRKRLAKRDQAIVDLYREGSYTQTEIGRLFDIPKQNVNQIIKRDCPEILPSRGRRGSKLASNRRI